MNQLLRKLLPAAALALAAGGAAASDIGVSVQIGQPGFYGRIDLGSYPQPQLIYPKPIVVQPVVGIPAQPMYLRVPPGHAKNWGKHCKHYDACGRPVYFVDDAWYERVYMPEHERRQGHGNGKGHGKGRKHDD